MFGNVTAVVGWIYIGEIQEQKHAAHMLQTCGLGSSLWVWTGEGGEWGEVDVQGLLEIQDTHRP